MTSQSGKMISLMKRIVTFTCTVTASRNDGIVEAGRDLWASSSPTLC